MKKESKISLLFIGLLLISIILSLNMIYADSNSNSTCVEKWKCDDWDSCYHGEKERECWDVNKCGTERDKPREEKDCSSYYDDYYYNDYNYYDKNYFNRFDSYDYYNNGMMYQRNNMMYNNPYLSEQNQNNPPQPEQPILVNLQYPGANNRNNYEDIEYQSEYSNNLLWIILASFIGILVIIAFIVILILALKRR